MAERKPSAMKLALGNHLIVGNIIKYLNKKDRANVSLTCKAFHSINKLVPYYFANDADRFSIQFMHRSHRDEKIIRVGSCTEIAENDKFRCPVCYGIPDSEIYTTIERMLRRFKSNKIKKLMLGGMDKSFKVGENKEYDEIDVHHSPRLFIIKTEHLELFDKYLRHLREIELIECSFTQDAIKTLKKCTFHLKVSSVTLQNPRREGHQYLQFIKKLIPRDIQVLTLRKMGVNHILKFALEHITADNIKLTIDLNLKEKQRLLRRLIQFMKNRTSELSLRIYSEDLEEKNTDLEEILKKRTRDMTEMGMAAWPLIMAMCDERRKQTAMDNFDFFIRAIRNCQMKRVSLDCSIPVNPASFQNFFESLPSELEELRIPGWSDGDISLTLAATCRRRLLNLRRLEINGKNLPIHNNVNTQYGRLDVMAPIFVSLLSNQNFCELVLIECKVIKNNLDAFMDLYSARLKTLIIMDVRPLFFSIEVFTIVNIFKKLEHLEITTMDGLSKKAIARYAQVRHLKCFVTPLNHEAATDHVLLTHIFEEVDYSIRGDTLQPVFVVANHRKPVDVKKSVRFDA